RGLSAAFWASPPPRAFWPPGCLGRFLGVWGARACTRPATSRQLGFLLAVLAFVGCSAAGPAPARFEARQALPAPTEPREIALTRLVSKLPVGALAQEAFVKAVGSSGRAQLR